MYNNNIITAPVSIYDLQQCFNVVLQKTVSGETQTKLSDDLGVIIAKSVGGTIDGWTVASRRKINMWAKYKPVIKNVYNHVLTDAERESVNYGIGNIPTWDDLLNMATFWLLEDHSDATSYPDCGLNTEYWAYNIPQGTLSAPFRITDFAKSALLGYYHGSEAPVAPLADTSLKITPNGQLVMAWPTGVQDDMTLKYTDLTYYNGSQISLSGFYFTAMLARVGSTSTMYVMTDENQDAVSALQHSVHCRPWFQDLAAVNSFLGGSVDSAQFYCMVFMCNEELYDTFQDSSIPPKTYRKFKTSFTGLTADKFVALFARQTVTITKVYAEITIDLLQAGWSQTVSHNIDYRVIVTNTESTVQRNARITVEGLDSSSNVVASTISNQNLDGGETKTIENSLYGGIYYNTIVQLRVTTSFVVNSDAPILAKTNSSVAIVESVLPPLS